MLSKLTAFQPNHLDFDNLRTAASFARKRESVRDWQAQAADPALPPELAAENRELAEIAVLQRLESHAAATAAASSEPSPTPRAEAGTEAGSEPDPAQQRRQQQLRLAGLRVQKLLDLHSLLQDLLEQPAPPAQQQARLLRLQARLMQPYLGQTALSDTAGFAVIRPFLARQNQKLEALKQNMADSLPRIAEAEAKAATALKKAPELAPSEKAALLKLGKLLAEVLKGICSPADAAPDLLPPEAELPAQTDSIDAREHERQALLQRGLRTLQTLQQQFQQADQRLQKFGLGLARWAEVEWQKLRRQAIQSCESLARQWQALEGICPELLPAQSQWLARLEQAENTQELQKTVQAQRQLLLQNEGQATSPDLLLACSNALVQLSDNLQSWLPRLETFAQVKPWKQAAQQYQALLAQFDAAQPQLQTLEDTLWQIVDSEQGAQILGQAQQVFGKLLQGLKQVNLPALPTQNQEESGS